MNKKIIFMEQKINFNFLIKIYYLIALLITICVLTSLIFKNTIYNKSSTLKDTDQIKKTVSNNDFSNEIFFVKLPEETSSLNAIKIEEVVKTNRIPDIVFSRLPTDMRDIKSVDKRKKMFIKIVLPLIVKENEKLISLNRKIKLLKSNFDRVTKEEATWLKSMMKSYKVDTLDNLLLKVDAIPVSLALAQAVIESGWGTSRFAYEGNALFGQYIWDSSKDGIIPNERESNAKYKIKSFNSLRESVSSYMKNLNTNHHYKEFRMNRYVLRVNNLPLDGKDLVEYLYNYSIEDEYPSKIKNIIEINKFDDFENLTIEKNYIFKSNEVI